MIRSVRRWTRRVPFRQQLTDTECAAACLAMITAFHGRDVSVAQCRDVLGPGRDGVLLTRLVTACAELGMEAELVRGPESERLAEEAPFVAVLSRHHLVVVERLTARGARVVDPSSGRQWLDREIWRAQYGGLALRVRPGEGFTRFRRRGGPMAWRYVRDVVFGRGQRALLGTVAVVAGVLQVLGLALPLTTKYVVDSVVPRDAVDVMPLLGAALAGMVLLHGVLSYLRQRMLVAVRVRANAALTQEFVDHLWRLPLPFFQQRSRGDLLLRLQSVSTTREALTQQVLSGLLDVVTMLGYAVVLCVLVPAYLPVVGLLALAQALLAGTTYARLTRLSQRELTVRSAEQGYLVESLDAVVPVRANGVSGRVRAAWRVLFDRYQDAMAARAVAQAALQAGHVTLATATPLALLWWGLHLVLHHGMSLGTMLAANSLALSLLAPVQTLVSSGQLLSTMRAQIERIYDVLDSEPEPVGSARLPGDGPLSVIVRDVVFRHVPDGPAVLDGVGFTIPAGGKVGVVGRTGAGKSTLGLVVLGLLRPCRGQVLLDDIPVTELDGERARAGCGAVLQELNLFNGSIKDNLLMGDPEATPADMEEACTIAGLHEDVMRLPMRYDTPVGEGGAALSAGQRQRVALARALVSRPRLLLLDEATSHLDPVTEARVDEALTRLQVTRLVISHRVSAVRGADHILVLSGGRVVDEGRHEDLIGAPGLYREMFADSAPAESVRVPQPARS